MSFIWKHQYFHKNSLKTFQGEDLQIIHPGEINSDSGPDFSNARIMIGTTQWGGPVEIHIKASDWYSHNHQDDPLYNQVILHVVWVNDRTVTTDDGMEIPVLELKRRVDKRLLFKYKSFEKNSGTVPCEPQLKKVSHEVFSNMLDYTFTKRLSRKSKELLDLLKRCNYDWDQVTYLTLGRNFGFKINDFAFGSLANSVPLSVVRKMSPNIFQLEALYFGSAGFLDGINGDDYYFKLQKEYQYLKKKHSLLSGIARKKLWKYLRLRPSNFPTLRIAQFASLMQLEGFHFSNIREAETAREFTEQTIQPSFYWRHHYDFCKPWTVNRSCLGKSSRENLVINTVTPLLSAYGTYTGQSGYHLKALKFIKELSPEQNRIVSYWKDQGFQVSSAYYSQALIELNNQYCICRKCLHCMIGQSLLTGNSNN